MEETQIVNQETKGWLRAELDTLKAVLLKNHSGSDEIKKIRYCVKKIEYCLDRLEKSK
jgi:hypothetical protein